MRQNPKLRMIVLVALLISMEIILTRFLSINLPILRISLGFIPMAICACMYGPIWGGIAYATADFIGVSLFSPFPPNPGFTLTAFLTGTCWGLFLHKRQMPLDREMKIWESIVPALIIGFILNLGLDTLWLSMLMHKGFLGLLPTRLVKVAITIPMQILLVPLIWNQVARRAAKNL